MEHIFIYGPPGAGKSTLGQALAEVLELPFIDLDSEIAAEAGRSIADIFAAEGEENFRRRELSALAGLAGRPPAVIALGGGALLDPAARAAAEAQGPVLCLDAAADTLLARTTAAEGVRPLLTGDPAWRLARLLAARAEHYRSFALRLDTTDQPPAALAEQAQAMLGAFRVRGMGAAYDARIAAGGLDHLGAALRARGLRGPVAVVSDRTVGALYGERAVASLKNAGYEANLFCFPPGEESKTLETVQAVWNFFLQMGVERGSTVAALGGGVVGDLAGFAAATFLRGVDWVNLPTTLLAMVDSSLGGKTGVDLPQGKNLVGAFHPPRLVLADPRVLESLPPRELRGGLAEALKHGVIADPGLFELIAAGWDAVAPKLDTIVGRAMAVKLRVIEQDPYERGLRQALNLGHTIGHGVELASGYRLSHGEAVAVGMVAEARLAERIGLAEAGLADTIAAALAGLGLPVGIPADLDRGQIALAMQHDKKRAAGQVRFALPVRIGEVRTGVIVDREFWEGL